jgi:hypothetical protein
MLVIFVTPFPLAPVLAYEDWEAGAADEFYGSACVKLIA